MLIAGLTAMPPRPARGLSAPPSKPALFSNPPPRTRYVQSLLWLLMNGPGPGNDALTYHCNLDPDGEAALQRVCTYHVEKAFPKGFLRIR